MTVEDKNFPVGMRVLAVDDDPICLKVLETLLRKCQYQVTITNQAVTALKLLRENRNKFDLVISDVNMPDMDGFKLLELVGLEMDLPVIMLSAHSDKELVYKGVTHGAVDYLLKPVRLEELKNIWQHVIRKKKLHPKDQNGSLGQERERDGAAESGQGVSSSGGSDLNGKVNRKRKDQNEEEEDEGDENGPENDEPGSQKKPRVVWSVELHRKFVAAVNQLGLDKAVPKKILDLMNVEGLTRENVASHLQKYRLYLKRLSNVASQQANMVVAFGAKDSPYLQMSSLDGLGGFHTLSGPGRHSSTSMLGRLNSPVGLNFNGVASSGLVQQGHSQMMSNNSNALGKLQPALLPTNQRTNLFQCFPSSLDSNKLQSKSTSHAGEFSCHNDTTGLARVTGFPDADMIFGSLGNTVSNASSNPLILQEDLQQRQSGGAFATQSLSVHSLKQSSFDGSILGSSNILDHNRCNENWQGAAAVQLSRLPLNSLPISKTVSHDSLPVSTLRDNMSSTGSHLVNSQIEFSSSNALMVPLDNSRVNTQDQAGLIGNVTQDYTLRQSWGEDCQGYKPNGNKASSSINSLVSGNSVLDPLRGNVDQRTNFDGSLISQLESDAPSLTQGSEVERSALDPKMRTNEDYLSEQTGAQNCFPQSNYEPFDDLMNAVMKQAQNGTMIMDGEFGLDSYPLGSCM